MNSLLENSYKKCKELNFENIPKEGVDKEIYDKVVERARDKIKKALRKHMGQMVLKTIYLIKKEGIVKTVAEILGEFSQYRGGLWRIAMVHSVASYVITKTEKDRISDIIDTCNCYFPCNGAEREREKVIEKVQILNTTENPDIFQYIEVYYSMGQFLFP